MELEFDKVLKLPVLNVGDIKNDIESCKIYMISHSDKYVYAIDIDYIDNKKENYKIGYVGRMIAYDVLHKDGMTTSAWMYPIDPFISKEEIIVSAVIIPYNNIATGNIEPVILELQKQEIKRGKMVIEEFPLLSFK